MATTKTMSLGDSNTTIDLQVNGSPVITAADVVSTYSATGTDPVDGKAVAEAIATVSSSGNNYWDKTEEYDGDVLWYSPHNGGGDYGAYPAGILFNSTNELDGVYWKTSSNGTYDTENCLNYSMMEGLVNHMSGGTTSGHHTISLARSLTSGTKVGTITLDGTTYDLYAPAKVTVSDTYSATSTNAMSGKAVASAIPTADIDANTAARHTHANQSVLDGIGTANVGNWNTAYVKVQSINNQSVLKDITADMVSNWNKAFHPYDGGTVTDADDAPMGMCTVYCDECANMPVTTHTQYWLWTFFNGNGSGIQLAKYVGLSNFKLYMRTKNASGTGAWKSITFSGT